MPKSTTDLRLAQSTNEHIQLTQHVEKLVDKLCHHGEAECANHLFELIELLTDTRTDRNDRESLAREALQRAFIYSDAGGEAMEAAILQVNPRIADWHVGRMKAVAS